MTNTARPARRPAGRPRATQAAPAAAVPPLPTRAPSLTEQAYLQLEELIVTLQLAPGSPVSEAMLSERLGIGRTPIREALQRLAREHLVVAMPQRGYLISHIDVRLQLRVLETRREVERLIAVSAAKRSTDPERALFDELARRFDKAAQRNDAAAFIQADREFNEASLKAARNEFAAGAMQLMHGLSRRFWYMHWRQAADLPETARAHAVLSRAIASGDPAEAGQALDRLLDQIEAFARATLTTEF